MKELENPLDGKFTRLFMRAQNCIQNENKTKEGVYRFSPPTSIIVVRGGVDIAGHCYHAK